MLFRSCSHKQHKYIALFTESTQTTQATEVTHCFRYTDSNTSTSEQLQARGGSFASLPTPAFAPAVKYDMTLGADVEELEAPGVGAGVEDLEAPGVGAGVEELEAPGVGAGIALFAWYTSKCI